jgi:hypothetical protein
VVPLEVAPLQVYPNPTKGTLIVKGIQGLCSGALVSLSGQVVLCFSELKNEEQLDISSAAEGTYLLRLSNGQTSLVIKQ